MTRVPELMAAGVTVAFGHDCVMDPWYALGSGDMLEVASMGLHVAQMTSAAGMRAASTPSPSIRRESCTSTATASRRDAAPTCVLLQARDPIEAIRLRATRLAVIRAGAVIAESPPATATLHVDGRPAQVDWNLRPMQPS